ncbi:MAG TPA: hypothetical protein PJ988_05410, partial [Anaerolinea sp.]|nr:hypothetical protein [Anaerolinea sp.]
MPPPIPARAEVEAQNSTARQQRQTMGADYQPRPTLVKPDFPAWNLYPKGRWNYALCVDEDTLKNLRVEWNEHCPDPLDAANPPLRLRARARRGPGWRIVPPHRARQFGHWSKDGQLQRGVRTIHGDFHFTPPLPNPVHLPARLSDRVEEIELIPYAATLLRVTVFPRG